MRNSRKDETLMAQGLDVFQRNTNTLIELISDLLDTSRIVAGTLTMEFKEVDLKQVLRASVETWRVQAAEKGKPPRPTKESREYSWILLTRSPIKKIKKNGEFVLPGFGKLVKQKRKTRTGFNPKAQQKIKIPAKTVVKFRIAKTAKGAVLGVKK